jgi:transcriptional regulator with XRE-family HTH domain
MQLNRDYVVEKCTAIGLNQNELASMAGVSKGTLSRALNGKRGAGRKLLGGLLRALPQATYELLIIENKN